MGDYADFLHCGAKPTLFELHRAYVIQCKVKSTMIIEREPMNHVPIASRLVEKRL